MLNVKKLYIKKQYYKTHKKVIMQILIFCQYNNKYYKRTFRFFFVYIENRREEIFNDYLPLNKLQLYSTRTNLETKYDRNKLKSKLIDSMTFDL